MIACVMLNLSSYVQEPTDHPLDASSALFHTSVIIIIIIIKVIGHCYNHHQSHLLSQNEPCWSASQASWASSIAWPRH